MLEHPTNHLVLDVLINAFINHFGEMGSRWGINRTVGQMYALLYLSEQPLNADDISQHLGFSRSNVSMGLKELQSWRLLKTHYKPSDRREYYATPDDVWEIFQKLAKEKQRREIEPTLTFLTTTLKALSKESQSSFAHQRLLAMHDLIEMTTHWFDEVVQMDRQTIIQLMKMGERVKSVLVFKNKLFSESY